MAVSLYRQYRPQTFAEVVGQDAAIDVLSHSLSSGRIGHAYLFSGPRGCGKTSVARILAKALNCTAPDGNEPCGKCPNCLAITAGESLDVVEIDGASNNSVDEVRELKSHVTLAPFSSKYKVYIIDEVHMLSTAAFNALLKTLEEPPSYVVFILATTEPHKVPVTIRSRCQHIPFHSIGARRIFEQLTRVCEWEKVAAQPEALWEVARQADGAMRDALSMLEQVINRAASEVALADVEATLGAGSRPALERWLAGLREAGPASYTGLKEMFEGGSPQRVFEELFSLVRNLWLTARWPDVAESLDVSEQEKAFLQKEAPRWKPDELRSLLASLVNLITQARQGVRSDVLAGLLMLALVQTDDQPEPPARRASLRGPEGDAALARSAVSEGSVGRFPEAMPVQAAGSVEASVPQEKPAPRRRQKTEPPEPLPPVAEALPSSAEEASQPSAAPVLNWQSVSGETAAHLLSQVQEADFTLYCGLLDAAFLEAEGNLLLDMGSRYNYETLRLERNCAGLVRVLPGHKGIFLRHGEDTFACPAELPPQAEAEVEEKPDEKAPVPKKRAPRFTPPPEESGEEAGAGAQENPEPARSGLPFGALMKDISRVMRGEVVLVRHREEEAGGGDGDAPSEESREEGSEA